MMTRKHYRAFADVIARTMEEYADDAKATEALKMLRGRMAYVMACDNHRFDRDRFIWASTPPVKI